MKTVFQQLQHLYPESSKNSLRSWLEKGRVMVGEKVVVRANTPLLPGQALKVGPRVAFAEENLKILYEDPYLVVVEKPAGLLSVATDTENQRTVHAILKRRKKKMVYPVHRLDQATSGIMLFAYTPFAQASLKKQFAAHTVERVYLGLIEGTLPSSKGVWKSFLVENDTYFMRTSTKGELAITHYEAISDSLVKFTLETGKKNQIRVHASEAGCPIVGDKKYGATTNSYGRLCLHAHLLSFIHPKTGKKMRFTSMHPFEKYCLKVRG